MVVELRGKIVKRKEKRPEIELWEYLQHLERRWPINICGMNQVMN